MALRANLRFNPPPRMAMAACPFCGSSGLSVGSDGGRSTVRCHQCGAVGPMLPLDMAGRMSYESAAVEAWNLFAAGVEAQRR